MPQSASRSVFLKTAKATSFKERSIKQVLRKTPAIVGLSLLFFLSFRPFYRS